MANGRIFNTLAAAADWIQKDFAQGLVMAAPLGLGKPNQLINEIYRRYKADGHAPLRIFTALSLELPSTGDPLAQRFLGPFRDRQWGKDYPELLYVKDLAAGRLPANIQVHEFYAQAGKTVGRADLQRHYISVNYTHAPYAVYDQGTQIIVQLVAKHPTQPGLYSLSCNPDITFDVLDVFHRNGKPIRMVGVVHPDLPYFGGDAQAPLEFFDAVVESPEVTHQLFALPRQPVQDADFLIGLQASMLIEDGGTLQIGIGSLSEALVYCMLLRHQQNALYRELAGALLKLKPWPASQPEQPHLGPFNLGLYGTSEMVMDGFMHLRRAGILKREVHDFGRETKRYLHGAFFLGSKEFYQWMRERFLEGDHGLGMTRVSKVNDLYDNDELALRRQRVKARFFNTCMAATLLGGAASDTKESGQVVSGVGGQFNFVAMSHELPDSHSVLMLRAARTEKGSAVSNIVWGQGQLTIPRHLRDVVISEYGIAFLKNRTDEQVVKAQLNLCAAPFQEDLRRLAVDGLKLDPAYRPPAWAGRNDPRWVKEFLRPWKQRGLFPAFPFGSDFTPAEERLAIALKKLKSASGRKTRLLAVLWRGFKARHAPDTEALERMGLARARGWRERLYRTLLLGVLPPPR